MVAHSYATMVIALVFGGLLLAAFALPINNMTDSLNDGVDRGTISKQTQHAYNWAVGVFSVILPLSIVGVCALWGITQANIGRDD